MTAIRRASFRRSKAAEQESRESCELQRSWEELTASFFWHPIDSLNIVMGPDTGPRLLDCPLYYSDISAASFTPFLKKTILTFRIIVGPAEPAAPSDEVLVVGGYIFHTVYSDMLLC